MDDPQCYCVSLRQINLVLPYYKIFSSSLVFCRCSRYGSECQKFLQYIKKDNMSEFCPEFCPLYSPEKDVSESNLHMMFEPHQILSSIVESIEFIAVGRHQGK